MLQLHALQVEGVAVVLEGHPGPVAHRARAVTRVDPAVHHRLVWRGDLPHISETSRETKQQMCLPGPPTIHSADGHVQFSIAGRHRPQARGGHVAAASHLCRLVVVPVGIRHIVFSQPSEAASLRREKKQTNTNPKLAASPASYPPRRPPRRMNSRRSCRGKSRQAGAGC